MAGAGLPGRRIHKLIVHFIGNDENFMPPRPFKNGFHFFGSIRHARGIGRGIEHQRAASGGTDPFQIFRRDAKPPRRGRRSKYRHGSGQSRHVGVACPVGYGNNYFITGINDAHQHIEQRLLAAGADSDVFNCGLKPYTRLKYLSTASRNSRPPGTGV